MAWDVSRSSYPHSTTPIPVPCHTDSAESYQPVQPVPVFGTSRPPREKDSGGGGEEKKGVSLFEGLKNFGRGALNQLKKTGDYVRKKPLHAAVGLAAGVGLAIAAPAVATGLAVGVMAYGAYKAGKSLYEGHKAYQQGDREGFNEAMNNAGAGVTNVALVAVTRKGLGSVAKGLRSHQVGPAGAQNPSWGAPTSLLAAFMLPKVIEERFFR